jgi:predicted dehydrogenase
MTPERLRVALVGCGQIADAHLQELRKVPAADVVAVCDRFPDLARQAAARFRVPAAFADSAEMLARVRPDVVHVTTPPHTHYALAREALRAGAHVYVEKPFTVDAAETDEVLRVAREAGRQACVGHDQLFDPAWEEFRRRFRAGEFGEAVHVDAVMGYDLAGPFGRAFAAEPDHWVRRLPGGLFHNNISHVVYKVTDVMPDDRPRVWATWFGDAPGGPPTELRVMLRGDRVTANLLFTSRARPVRRTARVYGTKRCVEVDFDGRFLRVDGPGRLPGPFAKIERGWREFRHGARAFRRNVGRFFRRDLHYFTGMRRLFEAFYASIRDGSAPPVPPAEIRRVTAIMDDIFRCCQDQDDAAAGCPTDVFEEVAR